MTDAHVALLLSHGFLTRYTGGPDGYLFSMPNAGAAVRSVAGAHALRAGVGPGWLQVCEQLPAGPLVCRAAGRCVLHLTSCSSLPLPLHLLCCTSPAPHFFSFPRHPASAAGRAEIQSWLQRRRPHELLESELEKRKMQRSVLGVRWHVTDMVGSGALLRRETAVGPLLIAGRRGG